jgi:hypothetical protein
VTAPLKELCEQRRAGFAVAIGPPIHDEVHAETTRAVCGADGGELNTIMIDGLGVGGCPCDVGGQTKFVCEYGPESTGTRWISTQICADGRTPEQERIAQRLQPARRGVRKC